MKRFVPSLTRFLLAMLVLTLPKAAPAAGGEDKEERGPKSPEARVRVTGKGHVVAYRPGREIVIRTGNGKRDHDRLKLAIPQSAEWPHLGSVFFEAIFEPPASCKGNFPVHSPMRPEAVQEGMEVWYALEGVNKASLQLYQIACHIDSANAAQFNAVVRNAVKLRESRHQPEIARDYQCRLIQSPKGSGLYPDNPALLEKFVRPEFLFPDRMDIKAPPPGHKGYGQGLKSSDVYENGIGSRDRRKESK